MGNISSVCLDDYLNDLGTLFPALEGEIETAFITCTKDGENTEAMMYKYVEPLIRHFLFLIGYGEYLIRVTDSGGRLKMSEITPLFTEVGIRMDTKRPLNLDDWKILMVAWVRRIQEIQRDEVRGWEKQLSRMQEEQQVKYNVALEAFRTCYLSQIETYHREVSEHAAKELAYRREWETQQNIQQKFMKKQEQTIRDLNEEATKNYAQREICAQQLEFVRLIKNETKKMKHIPLEGADRVFSYVYPCSLTSTGAPVSGGSVAPKVRSRIVQQ